MPFSFELQKMTDAGARAGILHTPHGDVPTPIFMPVGTQASVKALDVRDLNEAQAPIILANTYHLFLRPGVETLQELGGIHAFMNWSKPILTDSGGFQVFSLGKQQEQKASTNAARITEDGVEFTSHLDGQRHFLTPEKSIEVQRVIGADIIMAFDECTPDNADMKYAQEALTRTHDWARRCKTYWEEKQRLSVYGQYQALFGIIQGSFHRSLRELSAHTIVGMDFDGIAIGGETIGYNMPATVEVMRWLHPLLPVEKPRYTMGVGRDPQNILDAIAAGVDMFDCVAPTRLARNGAVYCGELEWEKQHPRFVSPFPNGRINIGNAQFARDARVIQPGCDCSTCYAGYSRAYLHHLYKTKELSYYRLASIHNVRFMLRLCEQLRVEILR